MTPTTDPLGDAITVLEHVRIEIPSARPDTEDAQNRVSLALEYLRMLRPGDAQGKADERIRVRDLEHEAWCGVFAGSVSCNCGAVLNAIKANPGGSA